MRDELKQISCSAGSLILNMDDSNGNGTHWTSLFISNNCSYYFDSFGLPPPNEVVNFCLTKNRVYSSFKIQKPEEVICGHYCIYMLYKLSGGSKFYAILNELYKPV